MTDEHVVEPRGEGDRDETAHGRGINGLGIGTLARLLVARETMNTGGVPRMETDEVGSDQVAVLTDVEIGDKVIIADVAFGGESQRSATCPKFSSRSAMTFLSPATWEACWEAWV